MFDTGQEIALITLKFRLSGRFGFNLLTQGIL